MEEDRVNLHLEEDNRVNLHLGEYNGKEVSIYSTVLSREYNITSFFSLLFLFLPLQIHSISSTT